VKFDSKVAEVTSTITFDHTTRMSFDNESIAFIMSSLTDMYVDMHSAIPREYVGNAYDSHILAGQTRPIEVTSPSALSSNFIVRDFGVGMSRAELDFIYSKYGASTKRDTNTQIGAFGLGAKSALALVAQFTVVSIKDGKRNTVVISKAEDGVGELNFLDEVDTDQENGVTVTIPVPEAAREKMNRALRTLFIGWEPNMVSVDGKLVTETIHNSESYIKMGESGWIHKSVLAEKHYERGYSMASWNNREKPTILVSAVVGPVSYKVDLGNLDPSPAVNLMRQFTYFSENPETVFNLPIGSVELTPSRESLIYGERTKKKLTEVVEDFTNRLATMVSSSFDSLDSPLEVLRASARYGDAFKNLTWKGETVPSSVFFGTPKEQEPPANVYTHSKTWNQFTVDLGHRFNQMYAASVVNNVSTYLNNEAILVHSSKDAKATSAFLREYTRTLKDAKGNPVGRHHRQTFFVTTQKLDEIDKWTQAIFPIVLSSEEVEEFGREAKRTRERAARAARALNGAPSVPVNTEFTVFASIVASSKSSVLVKQIPVKATEVQKAAKVVYVSYADDAKSDIDKLGNFMYEGLKRSNEYTNATRKSVAEALLNLLNSQKGVQVVHLPKGRSIPNFRAIFSEAVPVGQAIMDFAKAWDADLSSLERDFVIQLAHPSGRRKDWITRVTAGQSSDDFISKIDNADTRAWMTLLLSGDNSHLQLRGIALASLFTLKPKMVRSVLGFNLAIADSLNVIAEVKATEKYSYPLLAAVDGFTAMPVSAIIEYINLKDASTK
jgi:hypothetical protein